jgi:hypothetical protein
MDCGEKPQGDKQMTVTMTPAELLTVLLIFIMKNREHLIFEASSLL